MAANFLTASIVAILCVQNNKCADDSVAYLLTEQNIHAKFEHPICGMISKDLLWPLWKALSDKQLWQGSLESRNTWEKYV